MKKVLPYIIAGFFIAALLGCQEKKESKPQTERAINVTLTRAEKQRIKPFIEATGSLNAFEESLVSAEVDGIIKKLFFEEGNFVSRGIPIALIEDTDYLLEVKRAEAALRQAEASLANTRVEHERKKALFMDELVTKQQFDDVQMRLDLALAELDKTKATLNLARQRLSKTKILSPLSGYVKTKRVAAGDFIKTGAIIYGIIQNDPLKLLFTVNERDIHRVKVSQEVKFTVDSMPAREFKAKVHSIYPNLDEKTRSLTVEARVSNEKGDLKPGLFAKVSVFVDKEREAVLVPDTAILYEADKRKVFIVEGDKAAMRYIKTAGKYGALVEVIEGVKEGEGVVIVGQQNLSEGVKVNVAR